MTEVVISVRLLGNWYEYTVTYNGDNGEFQGMFYDWESLIEIAGEAIITSETVVVRNFA